MKNTALKFVERACSKAAECDMFNPYNCDFDSGQSCKPVKIPLTRQHPILTIVSDGKRDYFKDPIKMVSYSSGDKCPFFTECKDCPVTTGKKCKKV